MRSLRTSLLLAMAASALAVAPALAGGWATVSVDQGSIAGWQPGTPQEVGVTLMQHGVTPVNDGEVGFTLTNASTGKTTTASARNAGNGRWVATLTVPSGGDWALAVRHSGLEIQSGPIPITIGRGAAAAPAAPATAGAGAPAVVIILVLGVALAALLAVGVVLVARPERGGAARPG